VATNVFISYRRDDTGDFAGRLSDRLSRSPGIGKVFIDVAGIEPGADFVELIGHALAESEVCLVVIGSAWAGPAVPDGRTRIHEDGDFVRLEVRRALAGKVRVLPVLAHGAKMPAATALPDDLGRLPRLNAVAIRHDSFERDAQYLIDVILRRRKPSSFGAYLTRHPVLAATLRGAVGFVLAAVALIVAAVLHQAATGRSLDQLLGRGPVLLLIVIVLAAGTVLPLMLTRDRAG